MLEIRISIEHAATRNEPYRYMIVFTWDKKEHFDGLLIAYTDSYGERFRVAARVSAGLALAHGFSTLNLVFAGGKNAWGRWPHWKVKGEHDVRGETEQVAPDLTVSEVFFEQ